MSLKEWIFRKFLLSIILENLDKLLKKLPLDGAKTITGVLIAVLGLVLAELPDVSPYLQPILDALKQLPADAIIDGGLIYGAIGLAHKIIKWIVEQFDKKKK